MAFEGLSRLFLWFVFLSSMSSNLSEQTIKINARNTTESKPPTPEVQSNKNPITITVFLMLIGIMSILSNSLIIHAVRTNSYMHTSFNCLIVNMAVGDLMATIVTVVTKIHDIYTDRWFLDGRLGLLFCKLKFGLFFCPLLCSIYSLVAISIDRFMAVVCPLVYKRREGGHKLSICAVWLSSLLVPLHHIIKNAKLTVDIECSIHESQPDAYILLVAAYILPHLVITVLYVGIAVKLCKRRVPGEQRSSTDHQNHNAKETATKVTRMIVCILIAFDVCWAPLFFLYIGRSLSEHFNSIHGIFSKVSMISNGIFNIVIYTIFNANFRKAFKDLLYNKTVAFVWNRFHSTFRESSASVSTLEVQTN